MPGDYTARSIHQDWSVEPKGFDASRDGSDLLAAVIARVEWGD
jgi:hypothetical protein